MTECTPLTLRPGTSGRLGYWQGHDDRAIMPRLIGALASSRHRQHHISTTGVSHSCPVRTPAAHARPRQVAFLALTAALLLSLLAVVRPTIAAPVDAGFIDHSYGTGVGAPTEDKPQSKVWFADGSWWGGLFVDGSDDIPDPRTTPRTTPGPRRAPSWTQRNSSHGDYLWDGSSLYVASVNGDTDVDPILVFKFTLQRRERHVHARSRLPIRTTTETSTSMTGSSSARGRRRR